MPWWEGVDDDIGSPVSCENAGCILARCMVRGRGRQRQSTPWLTAAPKRRNLPLPSVQTFTVWNEFELPEQNRAGLSA